MSNFVEMLNAISAAAKRYPNCKIANCDCRSKTTMHWKRGCYCGCHFSHMDKLMGKDKWKLSDFSKQSNKGHKP